MARRHHRTTGPAQRAGPFCVLIATRLPDRKHSLATKCPGEAHWRYGKGGRETATHATWRIPIGTRWYPGVWDPDFGTQTSGPRLRDPNFGTTAANTQTAKCTGEAHWRYDKSTRNCNARYVANSYWHALALTTQRCGTQTLGPLEFGTLGVWDPDFGTLEVWDPDFGTTAANTQRHEWRSTLRPQSDA